MRWSSINYSDDVITHNKKGKFEYLTFKSLEKYNKKLIHGITLRHGGVSGQIYSSLNLRNASKDEKENVLKNIEIICKNFLLDSKKVYKARQNHTDNILIIDSNNKEKYEYEKYNLEEYDAYIIKEKNISNFITTADCNPIIVYDINKNIVASVHAGWKGVISKIYIKTIKILLNEFNSNVEDLIVCIGPSIRKCCFSSEDEKFKEKFTNIWPDEEKYIKYDINKKKFYIDMIYLIKNDLLEIGIKSTNISVANICTCCEHENFYSYRYATKKNLKDYATFSTWISLK